jgi:hypothetical protein
MLDSGNVDYNTVLSVCFSKNNFPWAMTWFDAKLVGWFMNLLICESSSRGPAHRPKPDRAKDESVMLPLLG